MDLHCQLSIENSCSDKKILWHSLEVHVIFSPQVFIFIEKRFQKTGLK